MNEFVSKFLLLMIGDWNSGINVGRKISEFEIEAGYCRRWRRREVTFGEEVVI